MNLPRRTYRVPLAVLALASVLAPLGLHAEPRASDPPSLPDPVAGVIGGLVVDSATGRPLAAAQVRLVGIGRVERTHDDGTFRFANIPGGVYAVAVQRIGYAPVVRQVQVVDGDTTTVRIAMTESAAQLGAVVVTGTVGERLAGDLLSPGSVLSGAALDRSLGATLATTVAGEPGIAVTSVGPNTARPVIRGLSGDRILLLEDGQRPGDLSSTSGDHAVALEPLTAQQIEVVRGPMALLYGPNALGGVVNLVREEVPTSASEHPHGVVTLEASSANGGMSGGGYGTIGVGSLALRGEASMRNTSDLRTPIGSLEHTSSRTYNLSGGAAVTGEWGHAGASYRYYGSDYGIPGGFVGSHAEGVDIDLARHTARVDAERHLEGGPFTSLHTTGAFTHYEHDEIEHGGQIGTSFGQDLAAADIVARHDAWGVMTQGAVGVRGQWRDIVTGGSLRTPNTRDYTVAGFVVEEAAVGALRVQGGVRYDWARYTPLEDAFVRVGQERIPTAPRSFGAVSGALGVLWPARDWLTMGASVARAYRTPDFNELYSDGPHLAANSYDVGDPRLRKETGIGTDAFARLHAGPVRAEVSVFHNELADFIYLRNTGELGRQGGRNIFQYTNTDATLAGAEATAEWSVAQHVVVNGTASYVRGRITGPRGTLPADPELGLPERPASDWLPLMPPLHGRVGARYETPRWFVGADLRAAARQSHLGDFETETAGYGTVDMDAGVRLLIGGRLHSLTLRAENVLDREYREHLSRTKEIMPQAGLNLRLLYRALF